VKVIAEGLNRFDSNKKPIGIVKYLPDTKSVTALIRSGKLKEHIVLAKGGTPSSRRRR
jgi:hypothetical protein